MSDVGLRVPYLTAWSDESMTPALEFVFHPEAGGLRLTYGDPISTDWRYGVLRARQGLTRGGRPQWKRVNTLRQWRCMEHRLCQVCGRSAIDPESGRIWWLVAEAPASRTQDYVNGPPTCRACIPEAIATCPRLGQAAALFTVGDCEPYAVLASVFRAGSAGRAELVERNALVRLEEFRALPALLAQQLVVLLHDVQPVPIGDVPLAERPVSAMAPGQVWSRVSRGGQARDHVHQEATCEHTSVAWTYQDPLPDGVRCKGCGTWWRLDLAPPRIAARLKGGIPPREKLPPTVDGRTSS